MKRFLLFLIMLLPGWCQADHIMGADLYYAHISGNTYRVFLTIYGQCGEQNFSNLTGITPEIKLMEGTGFVRTFYLKFAADSTKNFSPYCPAEMNNTKCSGGTLTGVIRYIYTDTITLPYASANWKFRFTSNGNTSCGSRAGRPSNPTNWINYNSSTASRIILDATLNNTIYNNSSPLYTNTIFPIYCINVPQVYSQTATDIDGDSLVYTLVPGLQQPQSDCSGIAEQVPYQSGYTYDQPLAAAAGSFSFNPVNGSVSFTPNQVQVSIVNTQISEYRNGSLIGSSTREVVFYVLGTCNNQPPSGNIDTSALSLQGGVWEGNNTIRACPGSEIRFRIPVTDANGDTVRATVTDIPSGSNVTISNNNSDSLNIGFYWNTTGVANGTYVFKGTFRDKGCPFPTTGVVSYTIIIDEGGDVHATQISATDCIRKAAVRYDISNGNRPYTLTLTQNNSTIRTYPAGILSDSLDAGVYELTLTTDGLSCTKKISLIVTDSGRYPYRPEVISPVTYCRNAVASALSATGSPGAALRWYDADGNELPAPPTPGTSVAGTYPWYVRQSFRSCLSDADTILVSISEEECEQPPVPEYEIRVPNVITPNGDGKNDRWIIDNIASYPNAVVQLFDKVGNKVYEQRSYRNEFDGGSLPSGVYYYLVRLGEPNKITGKESYTGYLMIKR